MIRRPAVAMLLAPVVLLGACGSSSRSSAAPPAMSARAAAATAAAGFDSRIDSGLRLRVLIGPTCPVERVGQSCVRPYQASIRILRAPNNRLVTTVRSGTDGRVVVRLRPGRYLLVPRAGHPFPHSGSQAVVVYAHRFTSVTVIYDSGIR